MSFFNRAEGFSITNSSFNNIVHLCDTQDTANKGLEVLYRNIIPVASYDAEQRYPPPNCYPGTRTKILDVLRKWIIDRSKTTSIYWLYGPAGAGKSAIAQTICEEFAKCKTLAASFFFARTDSSRNNPRLFFLTIAYQIAKNPSLGPLVGGLILEMIGRMPEIVHATLERQFQELIVEPFHQLPSDSWRKLPRLIVIDGLDECVDISSQERLLTIIREAKTGSNPLPVDFLICCRPEPRIRNAFNHWSFHTILNRIELCDNFESKSDIALYLRNEFQRLRRDHEPAISHVPRDWPGEGVIQQLVQRACGQFIYVKTVIKYVGEYHYLPTERLEIILRIVVPENHESPYADLDLLYTQILSVCKERELLLRVLAYIMRPTVNHGDAAIRDLPHYRHITSYSHIEGFLFLTKGKMSTVLFGLHSILGIPEDHKLDITILHASFQEFLVDPKRSGIYFVNLQEEVWQEQITLHFLKQIHYLNSNPTLPINFYEEYVLKWWHSHCVRTSLNEELFSALERLYNDLRNFRRLPDGAEWGFFAGLGIISQWAEGLSESVEQEVNKVRLQMLSDKFRKAWRVWAWHGKVQDSSSF
ncbi:hypothetical protein BDP27DRAFT_1446262 [Rhodocollybia butyracea]|uniref:Nephrocystin 3-like N-terminal domain-containing protein n=1 Tax=Rhodocollybia butyracea TaxID=206335 RepID=A0A9P5U9Z8_9AGAR|nr:hypothetical protein BDP27DRAFT_1446262 [Rhodocollybia butyracea]